MFRRNVLPAALLASVLSPLIAVPAAVAQTQEPVTVVPLAPITQAPVAVSPDQPYLEALQGLDLQSAALGLKEIWSFGLIPQTYWTEDLEAALQAGRLEAPGVKESVQAAFLRALKDLTLGVTDPSTYTKDIKLKRKTLPSAETLKGLVNSMGGQGDMVLELMAPQFAQYRGLREAMLRLYPIAQQGGWEQLPALTAPLKLGSRGALVTKLEQRLKLLGHNVVVDEVLDQDTVKAINDIQTQLRMTPDGVISPRGKTWGYLQIPVAERVQQVRADMEKLRWLPQTLETRHIFVNLAFSSFLLADSTSGQTKYMSFRAINGRPARKTPTMRDRVTYLVLNPTWTVPPTVFLEDKVEHIKGLPDGWAIRDYFAQNLFDVYTPDFRTTIDPAAINWHAITSSNVPFYIRQRPNYYNALGVVKFMMTNSYAIYLHDTNERHLFSERNRQRSSGCVRLERPLDLAEYLLQGSEWDRRALENFVVKPGQHVANETRVNLKTPIAVYLVSQTSMVAGDGILRFTEDTYGHNALIVERLKNTGR